MNRTKIFFLSQLLVVLILGTVFSISGVPNFFSESSLDDRVLENQNKEISFTGSVINKIDGEKGRFLIKDEFGKEFTGESKNLDLQNFLGLKNFFLKGEIFFDKFGNKLFNVEKISKIEEEILEEPKKFFLENKFGGYGFEVDENIFSAVKGGSKTFLKNGSGEVILKFFSYEFSGKGSFFSDGGNETALNGINGEIKSLENGQEIFLKNPKLSYGVLIQVDYGKTEDKDEIKRQVYDFLQNFTFIQKESISKQKCGGKENALCSEGYFCELFSTQKNANGRCVKL